MHTSQLCLPRMMFEKEIVSSKFSNIQGYSQSFFILTLLVCNWTCFYSAAVGALMCYANRKNKITLWPANVEDFWCATFKVTK